MSEKVANKKPTNNKQGGEKKPQQQKDNNKPINKDNKDNKQNKINNNNNNNNTNNKDNKFPPDAIYDGIQKKIEEKRKEITDINGQLEKLKVNLGELRTKRTELKDQIDKFFNDRKNRTSDPIKDEAKELRNVFNSLVKQQDEKRKALQALEDSLPVKINKNSTPESTLILIENKVRELEEQIENELNANKQRALLKQSSQTNANKRAVEEYFQKKNEYEELRIQIAAKKEKLNEIQAQIKPNEGEKEKNEQFIKDLKDQRTAIETEIKEKNDKFNDLKKRIDEIKKEIEVERANQEAHVAKRKEQRKQEFERVKQERLQKKLEYEEKIKKEQEKRIQEDLLKVAYEAEMNCCDSLISYLQTIAPKEQKDESSNAGKGVAEIEEGFELIKKEKISNHRENPKKKATQQTAKPLPEVIKHPLEIFSKFEKLSMVPPPKYSDIADYLEQIKTKKEYYSKLSAKEMEERVAKAKADAEKKETENAAAATTTTAAASQDSSESTPAASTPSIDSTTTTTTTATTTDNTTTNNVEVEAQ